MKTIKTGYKYELESFEAGPPQVIQFIEKEPHGAAGALRTVNDGTTNEEVLSVMIARLKTQHDKLPSRESAIVITKLEESLMWLTKRTADRLTRGVEGRLLA